MAVFALMSGPSFPAASSDEESEASSEDSVEAYPAPASVSVSTDLNSIFDDFPLRQFILCDGELDILVLWCLLLMLCCTPIYDSNFYLSVSGYNLFWFSLMILLGLRWMLRSFSSLPDRLPPRVQWSISSLPDRQPPSAHVWYVPVYAVTNGGNDKHYWVLDSVCARIMKVW